MSPQLRDSMLLDIGGLLNWLHKNFIFITNQVEPMQMQMVCPGDLILSRSSLKVAVISVQRYLMKFVVSFQVMKTLLVSRNVWVPSHLIQLMQCLLMLRVQLLTGQMNKVRILCCTVVETLLIKAHVSLRGNVAVRHRGQ